ncbi:HTTM domain-containing protein [Myxococcaceae bacterium JPH2]|nr:HTTM domain-containing protein [Myxococcaceae bacterium JPH2]
MSTLASSRSVTAPRWVAFVSTPGSPEPLAVFRVGVALLLLIQVGSLADTLPELLGSRGLVPWSVSESLAAPWMLRLDRVTSFLGQWGLSPDQGVRAVVFTYGLALVGLLLGWRTRVCALVAWLAHSVLLNSGNFFAYGVETFAHISLFYCVVMPVGAAFSLDLRAGRAAGAPSSEATLALRVLQLHLCVIYFATGAEKLVGPTWRDGTALWEVLMQPQYGQFDFAWLAQVPWLVKLASWGTLVIEAGYPVLIWPARTRPLWVVLTLGMHLGIAVLMGLWLFSGMMGVLTFSAFGWEWVRRFLPARRGRVLALV